VPWQPDLLAYRIKVPEYHRLIELGILTEDDNLELLDGYLVHKVSRNPPHDAALQKGTRKLLPLLPAGWDLRAQCAVTLAASEPEPDFAVVRGDATTYLTRHPSAADLGMVGEVSDSTLLGDRDDKGRIYAEAGIATYWIINLIDGLVEVYTAPSGPGPQACYAQRVDYRPGDRIPLVLGGITLQVAVQDLLP
jgi:Uma2 family endonuclease